MGKAGSLQTAIGNFGCGAGGSYASHRLVGDVLSDASDQHFGPPRVSPAEALAAPFGDLVWIGDFLGLELEIDDALDDRLALGFARRMPACHGAREQKGERDPSPPASRSVGDKGKSERAFEKREGNRRRRGERGTMARRTMTNLCRGRKKPAVGRRDGRSTFVPAGRRKPRVGSIGLKPAEIWTFSPPLLGSITWLGYAKLPNGKKPRAASAKGHRRAHRGDASQICEIGSREPGSPRSDHPGHAAPSALSGPFRGATVYPSARGCGPAHPAPSSDRRGPPRRSPRKPGPRRFRRRHGSASPCGPREPCQPPRVSLVDVGGLLYLRGRYPEAASMLARAARWGTTDKPLYLGHLALVELAQGASVPHLERVIDQLAAAPCGQGYGRFILGRLSGYAGRRVDAMRYLEAFVKRTQSGRPPSTSRSKASSKRPRRPLARRRGTRSDGQTNLPSCRVVVGPLCVSATAVRRPAAVRSVAARSAVHSWGSRRLDRPVGRIGGRVTAGSA